MKNLLIITLLLSSFATISVFASEYEDGYEEGYEIGYFEGYDSGSDSYEDGYNEGYEEGYEAAEKKSDGLDIASIVGGFILGYGFHEIFISKKDD